MSVFPAVRRNRFQTPTWVAPAAFAVSRLLLLLAACTPLGPNSKPVAARAVGGGFPVAFDPDCEGEGKGPLDRVSGPTGANGEVEIEREGADDQEFEVKVDDLEPHATYIVCVQCSPNKAMAKSSAAGAGSLPQVAATQATLQIPDVTSLPLNEVIVPVRVQTSRTMTYAGFVVEYLKADLVLLGVTPGGDAASQGFTDLSFNETLPFTPTTGGLDGNVAVQITNPNGTGTMSGAGPLEIVRLRFQVQDRPGHTSVIAFDRTVPVGLPRTFLEVQPNTTLTGVDSLAFDDGSITILGGTSPFDCVGFIHTDCDGEGELELKTEHGDTLPCGVASVCELQSLGGHDRIVEVKLGDENGPVVLRGVIPQIHSEDDDDDDDCDHRHDGDDDDDDDDDHDD